MLWKTLFPQHVESDGIIPYRGFFHSAVENGAKARLPLIMRLILNKNVAVCQLTNCPLFDPCTPKSCIIRVWKKPTPKLNLKPFGHFSQNPNGMRLTPHSQIFKITEKRKPISWIRLVTKCTTCSTSDTRMKTDIQIQEGTKMSLISEFYPQLLQKGYTEREIRESAQKHQSREVPDSMKHRFDSYEEYLSHCMDYINGLWVRFFLMSCCNWESFSTGQPANFFLSYHAFIPCRCCCGFWNPYWSQHHQFIPRCPRQPSRGFMWHRSNLL